MLVIYELELFLASKIIKNKIKVNCSPEELNGGKLIPSKDVLNIE